MLRKIVTKLALSYNIVVKSDANYRKIWLIIFDKFHNCKLSLMFRKLRHTLSRWKVFSYSHIGSEICCCLRIYIYIIIRSISHNVVRYNRTPKNNLSWWHLPLPRWIQYSWRLCRRRSNWKIHRTDRVESPDFVSVALVFHAQFGIVRGTMCGPGRLYAALCPIDSFTYFILWTSRVAPLKVSTTVKRRLIFFPRICSASLGLIAGCSRILLEIFLSRSHAVLYLRKIGAAWWRLADKLR